MLGQDGIQAALLGLTSEAKKSVLEEFTSYGNSGFRGSGRKNSDWIPDMDNGGAGMLTLQFMLMQCDANASNCSPRGRMIGLPISNCAPLIK